MLNILNLHSAVGQLHLKKARQESMYLFKINTENNFFHIYTKKARERQKQHFDYKRKLKMKKP